MRISIHQPEHAPWLGFFHKMSSVELFVLMDIVQYRKQYFQNRNKVRSSDGYLWFTVPVITKNRRDQLINEVKIDSSRDKFWAQRIWKTIENNYSKTPYFSYYGTELNKIYCDFKWDKLVDLNISLIKQLSSWLGLKTKFINASSLGVEGKSTDLIISICQKLNAKAYLSGRFGKNYLEEFKFDESDIRLEYHNFHHPVYKQKYDPFVPEMSVIDLLMCHGEKSLSILTSS